VSALGNLFSPTRAVAAVAAAALATAVIALPLLEAPHAHAAVAQTPGLTAGKTLSGMINHQGPTYANTFGSWRGAPITAIDTYTAVDSWASITAMGSIGWWSGLNAHQVWSMPLIPEDGTSTLEAAAAGNYDSYYKIVAQKLIAGGDGSATMRLGWEFTGDWFGWNGLKDPAAFAGAFRHAVTAMRSVAGGHFTFDWDPALEQADPTPMWPGDAYVDIVSADTYDNSWSNSYAPSNHVAVWNQLMTGSYGWNWLNAFAVAHGKRIAVPEWGVRYMCDGHGGGDDVYFIDQMRKFIQTHDVAYETYFDANDNTCSRFMIRGGDFPNAAKEYQKLWSTAGQAPVTPPTTAPPSTTPPSTTPPTTAPPSTTPPTTAPPSTTPPTTAPPSTTPPSTIPPSTIPPTTSPVTPVGAGTSAALMVSYSPDLSWPTALNGLSVDHNVYPYYPSLSGVSKVVFAVDGTTVNTDTTAPWTLVGATPALVPSTLKAGAHTVTATVTMSTGVTLNSTAGFTVPASVGTPVTTTPATGAALMLSYSPDHSWASALNGVSVDHNVYIYYPSQSGVSKVVFTVDGKAFGTDTAAPWNLTAGTLALVPSTLTKGWHTVVATVTMSTGTTLKSTASFSVPTTVGK
jgi:Glycosyl hydrolase family 26